MIRIIANVYLANIHSLIRKILLDFCQQNFGCLLLIRKGLIVSLALNSISLIADTTYLSLKVDSSLTKDFVRSRIRLQMEKQRIIYSKIRIFILLIYRFSPRSPEASSYFDLAFLKVLQFDFTLMLAENLIRLTDFIVVVYSES